MIEQKKNVVFAGSLVGIFLGALLHLRTLHTGNTPTTGKREKRETRSDTFLTRRKTPAAGGRQSGERKTLPHCSCCEKALLGEFPGSRCPSMQSAENQERGGTMA